MTLYELLQIKEDYIETTLNEIEQANKEKNEEIER